jgi:DNA-binding response OmpR family regulator
MDEVRIICISGMVEPERIQQLKDAGANDFVKKPFDVDALVERVCQLLDIETAATS